MEKINKEELMKVIDLTDEELEKIPGGGKTQYITCKEFARKKFKACASGWRSGSRASCDEQYRNDLAKCTD